VLIDRRPDRPPKEKRAIPGKVTAQFSKQESRNDFGASRPSLVNLATFRPFAQGHFKNFTQSNSVEIGPADSYGYGNGSAIRGRLSRSFFSEADYPKIDWRTLEQPSPKLTLVQNVPNLTFSSPDGAPQDDIARWQDFHRSLAQRYADRDHLVGLLTQGGCIEEAARLWRCGENLVFRQREDCGRLETWRILFGCNQRFCPFCSRSKSNDKFKDVWPVVHAYFERKPYLRPCSVVLTYKDDSLEWAGLRLKEKVKRTQQALRKFIRLKEFKNHITGGIWSIENTKNSSNNDHLHVHMLVFRMGYWVKQDLESLWEKSTGGLGGWTWIESRRDIKSSLKETLKYALKPSSVESWTVDDAVQFVECRGLRLTSRFGELYGFKLTEDEKLRFDALRAEDERIEPICPSCGRENEAVVDVPHTRLTVDTELKSRCRSTRGP